MEEKYIDLHVHSTNSDGALTPDKVIEETQKIMLIFFQLLITILHQIDLFMNH